MDIELCTNIYWITVFLIFKLFSDEINYLVTHQFVILGIYGYTLIAIIVLGFQVTA